MTTYLILSVLLIGWCILHSWMISLRVTESLQKSLGSSYRYYRLFYNVVALLTLAPVFWYYKSLSGQALYEWKLLWSVARYLIVGTSIVLFIYGARSYDLGYFLGFRQISKVDSPSEKPFVVSGALKISRHPWYLAAILLIWTVNGVMTDYGLLTTVILTAYLSIGTLLEERKLIVEFGEQYRQYQRDVSMLFPFKWILSGFKSRRL